MTEGRHCQVHLLDDRRLELLVQVGIGSSGVTTPCPLWSMVARVQAAHLTVPRTQCFKVTEGGRGGSEVGKLGLHVSYGSLVLLKES